MTTRTGPIFTKVALLGVGLIGASMAHAMRRGSLAAHIAGHANTEATRKRATELGFCDAIHADPKEAVRDADLVVFCTPVGAFGQVAEAIAPALKAGAIVTDVGSVKMAAVRDIGPHVPAAVHFIPGHPIAGTENSGPDAGFAELFDGRWCILTPPAGTDEAAVQKLGDFWRGLGSRVEVMDAKHHDIVLAITSHVPHLIAYNIVGTASDLAASDPTMWRDVFLNNREAVLEVLGRFSEDLSRLQRAIRWGEGDMLFDLFTKTRAIRREVIDAGQDTPASNFGRDTKKR